MVNVLCCAPLLFTFHSKCYIPALHSPLELEVSHWAAIGRIILAGGEEGGGGGEL